MHRGVKWRESESEVKRKWSEEKEFSNCAENEWEWKLFDNLKEGGREA